MDETSLEYFVSVPNLTSNQDVKWKPGVVGHVDGIAAKETDHDVTLRDPGHKKAF